MKTLVILSIILVLYILYRIAHFSKKVNSHTFWVKKDGKWMIDDTKNEDSISHYTKK